jgi:Protein of unknown function (DUF2911)
MVERWSTHDGATEGDVVDRSPRTTVLHYAFTVDGRGDIVLLAATQRAVVDSTKLLWAVTVERVRDGFDVRVREGEDQRGRIVSAPPEAIPLFGRSLALYELATTRWRAAGVDSLKLLMIDLDSLRVTERTVRLLGADSVVIPVIFPRGERARVDAAGHILGVSGLATSYKWLTERVPDLNIAALTQSFASRDASGRGLGSYSTRDTARAEIGGAHIAINYGRPSKRGRVIFGGTVAWGEVWRTGADLATHLTTDRALRFGGDVVPAGTYTIYTVPTPTRWTLIVNQRTGQSGLSYDSSADLAHLDMAVTHPHELTERLAITLERAPSGTGGALRISWDDISAEVMFEIVPLIQQVRPVIGTYRIAVCKRGPCTPRDSVHAVAWGVLVLTDGPLSLAQSPDSLKWRLGGFGLGGRPNGCYALSSVRDAKSYAGLSQVAGTRWTLDSARHGGIRFSLFRSPDAGHEVRAMVVEDGLRGTGESWGAGTAAPNYEADTVVASRVGEPDVRQCARATAEK